MLDELFKAAAAIEKAGMSPGDNWHGKFKGMPNGFCVRIWLNADGTVSDIEELPANLVAQLRKYEPDLGKALPAFNICPLYRLVKHSEDLKNGKANKALGKAITDKNFTWDAYLYGAEDFWGRTREVLKQIKANVLPKLQAVCDGKLSPDETLYKFLSAVGKLDIETFKQGYEAMAKAKARDGSLPASLVCYLVDEKKKKKEDADTKAPIPKASIVLDVKDYTEYPIAHIMTMKRLNDLLMENVIPTPAKKRGLALSTATQESDAYGGNPAGMSEKFDSEKIPRIGVVGLRSQVKAIPAQARYDLCEGETFPVGSETRKKLKAALTWLSDQTRQGQTFGSAGDRELLFAYPAQLPPDSTPELASLLGASDDEFLAQQKFEILSESVIKQLDGLGKAAKEGELHIFSLRKVDTSSPKTKVVYYRNTTIASLETASRAWDAGFKNIPPLDIRVWSEGKNDKGNSFPVHVEPQTVFPVKLHKLLNAVWTLSRNEIKQSKVKLFEPSTGLRLLLDAPSSAQPAYVAERFLAHSQTYFIALCRAKGRNEIADRKDLPNLETYPGILGLLLYKLGKTKENYMKESAFQLGRFLRVADEIHRLYCEVVRPNDKLPELCGSSLLNPMLESPLRAFNQLTIRVTPYLKWVKRFHGEEKSGLAHYWMCHWATIADALHQTNWPECPTPEERAQIFLGYLSSFQKSEKSETSTETTEPERTQQ